ncbi:MAG: hypothetical protein ABEJ27_00580 [Halodesulfurarchaeum sp.]
MVTQDDWEWAFENRGYDVGAVSVNRDQVRVTILEENPAVDDLRDIVDDLVGEENVLGFDVQRESGDASDGFVSVVSFRDRS